MTDTYQPTAEQIAALARDVERSASAWDPEYDDEYERYNDEAQDIASVVASSPAFQAIIRAAQAEAWGEGVTHSFQTIHAPIAYDAAIFADNPYRESYPTYTRDDARDDHAINQWEIANDLGDET